MEKIKFGTAGLRGIMGENADQMNVYTVNCATQALAEYLKENNEKLRVVVSYDTRNNSVIFAEEAAKTLSSNGIEVYITKSHSPTPFLSFCVRELKCGAGIMITASHNPAEYNGYKCYGSDGAQIDENVAEEIQKKMYSLDISKSIKKDKNKNFIKYVPVEVETKFLNHVFEQKINKHLNFKNLNVTYTPLNGAGLEFMEKIFGNLKIKNLSIVETQKKPDGNFTTCRYPNPELIKAFEEAFKIAKNQNSDIILATDPDADRLGVCVKTKVMDYKLLTGNELGILLFNYILTNKKVPETPICIKSNVSSPMINAIAKRHNCEVIEVLTGFKNIGKEILNLEKNGKLSNFIFSFEESGGYLTAPYARDKDAICAAMLTLEMAGFYEKSLNLILDSLYEKYGYFGEKTLNFEIRNIDETMQYLRKSTNISFSNLKILSKIDYLNNKDPQKANMLEFILENDCKFIIRPSGTEPKLKAYLFAKSDSKSGLETILKILENEIKKLIRC